MLFSLGDGLKVCRAVLAQGAHDVVGKGIALVDPAADLTYEALLAFGIGLGLYMILVVGVGHGLLVGDHTGLGYSTDEHAVGIQIHIAVYLQTHEGIDVSGEETQTVVTAQLLNTGELVCRPSALETEGLKGGEGGGDIQTVDIHDAGLLDHMVGVIFLVDGHSDAVGGVGDLGDGVDDETVVLGAVVGGDHIQSVADVKQGSQVVFVGGGILPGKILPAQLVGQTLDLSAAFGIESGEDPHGGIGKGDVLAADKHVAHHLGGQRRPGAVFHQRHGAVLEVPLSQMMDKGLHKGENICVVGSGSQHQLVIPEGILHSLSHIRTGKVMDDHLGRALFLQLLCQQLYGRLGVAVNGGIGNDDALVFRLIGGPGIVQVQIVAQVLCQYRAMEGANDGDVQGGGLFQQRLHLCAILAHNADVVTPCLTCPVLFYIQRAEFAEAVGGKQYLIIRIVGHDDLRPVDHGSGNKGQGVFAQTQGVTLTHHDTVVGVIVTEKVLHHGKGLFRRHHHGLRVDLQEIGDIGRVIRLHMLDHQIVGIPAAQGILNVVQPFVGKILIHGVHNGDLLIHDGIGIIRHTVGDDVLSFKQVDLMVVNADVLNVVGDGHGHSPYHLILSALYSIFQSHTVTLSQNLHFVHSKIKPRKGASQCMLKP